MVLVDFDFKLIVENTEENLEKIRKRGVTQFDTTPVEWLEFYPSEQDLYDDWYEHCDPIDGNEICQECMQNDYQLDNPEKCPRFSKVYHEISFTYETLRELVREVISDDIIVMYGCKKDGADNTRQIFGTNDFWEAYNRMKDWASETFDRWLSLGNDDLNGWEVEGWKVRSKEDYDKIVESIAWIRKVYWKGIGCIIFDQRTEKDIEAKVERLGGYNK